MLAEALDLSVSDQSNSPWGAGISLDAARCLDACRQANTRGAPVAKQTGGLRGRRTEDERPKRLL